MDFKKLQIYIRKQFTGLAIPKCFVNTTQIAINILNSVLLSRVIIDATEGNVPGVVLNAAVILIVKYSLFAFNTSSGIVLGKKESQKTHNCKMAFYSFFFNKPLKDLFALQLGETKEKINDDFSTITQKYASVYPRFITVVLSVIAYLVYLLIMNKWVALTLLLISVIQIIPPLIIKRFLQVNYDNCRKIEAEITDFIVEGYRGFLTIKLFNLKKWWQEKLAGYHKKYSKIGRASIYTGTAEGVLDEIVSKILTYGTYGIIGMFILNNVTSLDTGIQAIALSGSLFSAIKSSFSIIKDLALCKTAEQRLNEDFSSDGESDEVIKNGDIIVSKLSYSYEEQEIFRNVNLSIKGSGLIVIKGKNGGGKTTLLRLLSGILGYEEGEIRIDGIDPFLLSNKNYPRKLFCLPQDDASFAFSADELYDMILHEQKDKAVLTASKYGLSEELIFESKINDLSGGERKKVFLSLAFAVEPSVLMLDEPTNSLDEKGKKVLRDMLRSREKVTIVVTHDPFLDEVSDAEYFVENGGVIKSTV